MKHGGKIANVKILSAATATGAGIVHLPWDTKKTFHATGTTTAGAGAATITIEASNEDVPSSYFVIGTLSLTLATTISSDAKYDVNPWKHVRANVTAISGTGASVDVWMAT